MIDDEVLAVSTHERVVAAALVCLAANGLRRTTVDDVAGAAKVSRATLYRAFPGGRDTILAAVVVAERARLLGAVASAMDAHEALGDAVAAGLVAAASWLSSHEVLAKLMFDEPATVLTHIEFEQMNSMLATASGAVAPMLERFMEPDAARRTGEWLTRFVISYLLFPSDGVDLCDPGDVASLVERHVLPGLEALAVDEAGH